MVQSLLPLHNQRMRRVVVGGRVKGLEESVAVSYNFLFSRFRTELRNSPWYVREGSQFALN